MDVLTRYALRRATLEDLMTVVAWPRSATELRFLFPRATWPAETLQLVEHLASHQEGFVVCDEDRVVGFANLYDAKAHKAWIGHLIVHPDKRRVGVAHYLVSALKVIAKERYQASMIATICYENNANGLAFYQSLGFHTAGWETRVDHRNDAIKVFRLEQKL